MNKEYQYEVAISFAEEDRNAALALALALELEGFKHIYYYPNQLAATAGKKLIPKLQKIFYEEAEYIAILLSTKYLKKKCASPAKGELEVILKRMSESNDKMIVLPILLEKDLSFSGYSVLNGLGYFYWDFNPKGAAGILKKNFGADKPLTISPELPFTTPEQKCQLIQIQNNEAYIARNQTNKFHATLNFLARD